MASWNDVLTNVMGAIQGAQSKPVNRTGVIVEFPEAMSDEELARIYGDEDWLARNGQLPGPKDPLHPNNDPVSKYGSLPVAPTPPPDTPSPVSPAISNVQMPQPVPERNPARVRLENAMAEYDRWRNMSPADLDQKKDSVWKNMGKQLLLGTRELADIPPNMQSKEQLGFAVGKMAARALKGLVMPMADEQEILDYKRDEAMKKVAQAQGIYDVDLQNRTKEENIDWSQARQYKVYAEVDRLRQAAAEKEAANKVAQGKLAFEVYKNRDVFNPATNQDDASIAEAYRRNTGSILPVKEGKVKSVNTFSKNRKMYTEITYVDSSKGDGGVVRGYVREDGSLTQNENEAASFIDVREKVAELSAGARIYETDSRAAVDLARINATLSTTKAKNQLDYSTTRLAIRNMVGQRNTDGTVVTEEQVQDLLNKYAAENPGFISNE